MSFSSILCSYTIVWYRYLQWLFLFCFCFCYFSLCSNVNIKPWMAWNLLKIFTPVENTRWDNFVFLSLHGTGGGEAREKWLGVSYLVFCLQLLTGEGPSGYLRFGVLNRNRAILIQMMFKYHSQYSQCLLPNVFHCSHLEVCQDLGWQDYLPHQ